MSKLIHEQLSNQILACAFSVHSALGPGLLESCYAGAMVVELQLLAIPFTCQQQFPLHYKGVHIGDYFADLVVANTIVIELKAVQAFHPVMFAQVINYLKLSKIPVGYLINFNASSLEWKRFVLQVC